MKHSRSAVVFALLPLVLSGCTSTTDPLRSVVGSYRNYTKVKGKIEGGRYYSPANNFSCAVPPLIQPGAVILDNVVLEGGAVSFQDDMGTLIRLDYFLIPNERAGLATTIEGRKSLSNLIFNFAVERMYRPVAPDTRVTHTEYIDLQDAVKGQKDVALFGIALLPKGSSLREVKAGRYDALRASLVFVKGRYSYLLTIQNIPGLFGPRNAAAISEEARNKGLQKQLESLYGNCSFN